MKEKYRESKYRHRRRESSSSSSSDRSSDTPKRTDELYDSLKKALARKDQRQIYNCVRDLSTSKGDLGILRVTIPNTFSFQKTDIQDFFSQFGRIQNIIIKQPKTPDALQTKQKQTQTTNINTAYVIFSQYFSAVVALKVLQSVSQKEKIVDARICTSEATSIEEETFNPMLGHYSDEEFIVEINSTEDMETISSGYHYVGTIGIDLQQKSFCLKERIMGARGSNFLRVLYFCEKAVRLENQGELSKDDLVIKLIQTKDSIERSVMVMANSLLKYNTAIRYLHQLFQQIVQQYKNSRQKSYSIIPKDVHIRRWEKFRVQPVLKFLQPSNDGNMALQ